MFFGFGRLHSGVTEYRYEIIPASIPLWFPKHLQFDLLKAWMISLGNLLLFVPFGILLPMIDNMKYPRFIFIFVIAITVLEFLQMITYLGVFDVHDIMVNTMGATIGFFSYQLRNKTKPIALQLVHLICYILLFTVILITIAEVL